MTTLNAPSIADVTAIHGDGTGAVTSAFGASLANGLRLFFHTTNGSYYTGLAKFDISSLPADAVVSAATGHIYSQGGPSGTANVLQLHNAFTEADSTAAVAPAMSPAPTQRSSFTAPGSAQWCTFDALALVQAWLAGAPNHGIALRFSGPTNDFLSNELRTRESASAPYIEITYTRMPGTPGAITEPDDGATYDASIALDCGAATDPVHAAGTLQYEWGYSANNGGAWTVIGLTAAGSTGLTWDTSARAAGSAYKVRVRAKNPDGTFGPYRTQTGNFSIQHNAAPNPDTPLHPIGGAVIDKDVDNIFQVGFNDPDAGDHVSARKWRFRPVGSGSWTIEIAYEATTSNQRTFVGGTFAAGDWEGQSRPKDALGVEATDWSPSFFFEAGTKPPEPTITSHVDGGTISTSADALAWSAPDQDGFQVRVLGDDAGVPDPAVVVYDTEDDKDADAVARDHPLEFPDNGVWRHLQARIIVNDLASDWASVRQLVDYTEPAEADVDVVAHQVDGRDAALAVTFTNPAPSGDQPDVTHNLVWRREVDAAGDPIPGTEILLKDPATDEAATVDPNGTWIDWYVESVETVAGYQYAADTYGDNGTHLRSAWH